MKVVINLTASTVGHIMMMAPAFPFPLLCPTIIFLQFSARPASQVSFAIHSFIENVRTNYIHSFDSIDCSCVRTAEPGHS